jgi:hypothetical protein
VPLTPRNEEFYLENMKFLNGFIFLLFAYSSFSQVNLSQWVIGSGGGYSSTSSNNYSHTVGEAVINTQTVSSMILTQGFQQPLSASTSILISQNTNQNFSVQAYPNPTSNQISIEISIDEDVDINIQLIDVLGKQFGKIEKIVQLNGKQIYQCELGGFSSGIYFIKISSNDEKYNESIRIQKVE